jgi:hypothetical protein
MQATEMRAVFGERKGKGFFPVAWFAWRSLTRTQDSLLRTQWILSEPPRVLYKVYAAMMALLGGLTSPDKDPVGLQEWEEGFLRWRGCMTQLVTET